MCLSAKKRILFILFLALPLTGKADVDRVYHPFVEAYKTELEFRSLYKQDDNEKIDGYQSYKFSLGHNITERLSLEGYLIGTKRPGRDIRFNSFELEGKLQLTEQGEYWADFGLLFELERNNDLRETEVEIALLVEKEWGRWVVSNNLFVGYETGADDEFEATMTAQLKYRAGRFFEPAIELYSDEVTRGIGPVFLGAARLGTRKLKWELGLIFGFGKNTAKQNLRFLLDYEF